MICVSIVSHGHGPMVRRLVSELLACKDVARIVVTRNVPESLSLPADRRLTEIANAQPKGFGENHNVAFLCCQEAYFCVVNPDIELTGDPFPGLLAGLEARHVALVAPLVLSVSGAVEDSCRRFPRVFSLARKLFGGHDGRYHVLPGDSSFSPEWVAGMFMLIKTGDFSRLRGFDEGYFLYYEDVDICVRAWQQGMKVLLCPAVSVIHDAQRASHRNWRHLRWHLASMARYFWKHWGRLPEPS